LRPPNGVQTLANLGISKDEAARWQRLAAVPEPEFEAALAAPVKPSARVLAGLDDDSRCELCRDRFRDNDGIDTVVIDDEWSNDTRPVFYTICRDCMESAAVDALMRAAAFDWLRKVLGPLGIDCAALSQARLHVVPPDARSGHGVDTRP
jgi:hypothetical protein